MKTKRQYRILALKKCGLLILAMVWRFLHLPPHVLPARAQVFHKHWTHDMMWLYIRSLGTRSYMDQTCEFALPSTFAPKTLVAEAYRLEPEAIQLFYQNGFLGPYRVMDEAAMRPLYKTVRQHIKTPSPIYGFPTIRDRHLDLPDLMDLFRHPAITERVAQLLGPDLMIWRSQVFDKRGGSSATAWHQASTYLVEDRNQPILEPPNRNELFQLTVWIALNNVTEENGCLAFVPGTHRKIHAIRHGGKTTFYKARFELEADIDPRAVVRMPLRPGEFVIFTERVIHGSGPNTTGKRRMGVNFRVVPPSVQVYQAKEQHIPVHRPDKASATYDLTHWRMALLRGEGASQHNRLFTATEVRDV